ncbi:hypothetical protein BKA62DRAFT_423869 [Auriculariales sp. MPI-PUGE-AT-0066]|nr:hypothetical protein BKA62DRAFT_423869 [Auriculariales sp. MPI-PUGE-AT-0066]
MSHLTKQSLNGFMHHLGVDFTKMPVDAALALLRGPASQFFTAEATAYARQAINATVLELTLHFQTWDPNYYQEWVRSQSDPKAKEHATRFMQTYFDTAKDPYLWDSFTGEALMAELKEQYRKAGALAQSARDTATLERDAALKVIQAHDREVKEIQDRLNHDKTDPRSPEEVAKDHQRRAELDKELADEHKKVTDRQTEIDQREGERVRHDKDATDAEQRRKEQADRWKNKLDKVKH